MSQEINVTVEDLQNVNVSVSETPINVIVGIGGTQGIQGIQGIPGTGGGGGTTGDFISRSETGQFYPYSNPLGFSTSGDLQLYYLNSNPSGYITGFNSGLYLLKSDTGNYSNYFLLRNETGQFYPVSNPQQYIKSGEVISVFYLNTNPSGYISNSGFALISFITGISGNLQLQINSIVGGTGNFYLASNPQQYIKSGDVSVLYYTKNNESGFLNNLSGLSTGYIQNISGVLSTRIASTGSNLQTQINNFGPYANIVHTTGNESITGIKTFNSPIALNIITGINNSGSINIVSGFSYRDQNGVLRIFINDEEIRLYDKNGNDRFNAGPTVTAITDTANIDRFQATTSETNITDHGDTIRFKADANQTYLADFTDGIRFFANNSGTFLYDAFGNDILLSLSGKLDATGTNLNNLISVERNKQTVTGVSVTGSNSITGLVNIQGVFGTNVILSGNNIIGISGGGGAGISSAVTSLNTLINTVQVTGLGIITVSNNGQIIQISGSSPTGAGEVNTASNLGGGIGVFSDKSVFDLRFNSITGITGINVTLSGNQININSTLNTGQFYPASNLSQFSSSGNVANTGQSLYNLINGLSGQLNVSGGLLSAVKVTGSSILNIVNLTGAGNVIVSYSGQFVYFSGNTGFLGGYATVGNLQSTGSTLNSKINSLSGYLSDPSSNIVFTNTTQTIDGEKLFNGATFTINDIANDSNVIEYVADDHFYLKTNGGQLAIDVSLLKLVGNWQIDNVSGYITSGQSGQFYPASNPSQFSSSGNVLNTGQTLYNLINSLSGKLDTTGTNLQNQINTERNKNTVTGFSITGGLGRTGVLIFSAGNNITLLEQGNNTLQISSAGGGSSTNGVTGLSITGGLAISGAISINAGNNIIITQQGNNSFSIASTASSGPTGENFLIQDKIAFEFASSNIQSGNSYSQFIQFPQSFEIIPGVLASVYNNSGDAVFGWQLSGISRSGFYVDFSDTINTNNYNVCYLTTTGSGYFELLKNVSASNNGVTGISVTGGNSISGAILFTGIGGLNIIQVGNEIRFSGGAGGGGFTQAQANALSGFFSNNIPNVLLIHPNGTYTGYYGTTDLEKGSLLTGAIYISSSGDLIKLGPGNFEIPDLYDPENESFIEIPALPIDVSLLGEGITNTKIIINTNAQALSLRGNNNVNNLSLLNTNIVGGGCLICSPIDSEFIGTFRIKDVYLSGLLDCLGTTAFLKNSDILIDNAECIGRDDTCNGTAKNIYIKNSYFKINEGVGRLISYQLQADQTGKMFVQDCLLENNIGNSSGVAVLFAAQNTLSSFQLHNTIIKNITTGSGILTNIRNVGSGNLYVDASTIYDNTRVEGLVNTLPIFGFSGYSGKFITVYETGQFYASSNPAQFVNSGNLSNYYLASNPASFAKSGDFISGVSITGGLGIRGALNISAGSNISLTQVGNNTLSISSTAVGGSTILNPTTGFGTQDYVVKFAADNSGLINSNITSVGNLVGINVSSPKDNLDISGTVLIFNNDSFNVLSATGLNSTYQQINIQNKFTGFNTSSDLVATADFGNETTGYVDLGINSSKYSGQYIGLTGDTYLYSQANDFYIGNPVPNKKIILFVGSASTGINNSLMILEQSQVRISGDAFASGGKLLTTTDSGNLRTIIENTGAALQTQLGQLSRSTTFYNSDGIPTGSYFLPLWRAPFACTVTGVHGYIISGTNAVINARKNATDLLISNMTISPTGAWVSSGIIQNSTFAAGDTLSANIVSVLNFPTSVTIQVDFRRP